MQEFAQAHLPEALLAEVAEALPHLYRIKDKKIKKIIDPKKLNNKWIILALLALTPAPIDDNKAVAQLPMFVPKIIYNISLPPFPT